MNKVSKFINFPFFCDYGVISKKEFLSDKFTLGIKYFDIFTRNEPLIQFGDGSYGIEGPDLMIMKDSKGFWKLNDYLINEVRGD